MAGNIRYVIVRIDEIFLHSGVIADHAFDIDQATEVVARLLAGSSGRAAISSDG